MFFSGKQKILKKGTDEIIHSSEHLAATDDLLMGSYAKSKLVSFQINSSLNRLMTHFLENC